ncbi:MAG: type II toxin-antitoxin system RelE/ParE family toxin [Sedimentisphaerales bacterium]|nr:type II toxin-antitoxin system RelE/ParE family toxin [Sedimentisphaerales bacterium]
MTNKNKIDFTDDPLIKGPCAIVAYASRKNGKKPALDYIETLGRSDWAKLAKSFVKMAQVGRIHNIERFRKLGGKSGKIYEFKVYPKVRVLCFQLDKTWFLTHGFNKETGNTPPRQIDCAEEIMNEHISLSS